MSSLRVLASRQPAQAQTSSKKNQAQHPSPLKSIENRSIQNRSSVNRTSVPAYSLENFHIFAPGGVRRGEMQSSASALPYPIQSKLEVGNVTDPLEREADLVAEQVTGTPQQIGSASAAMARSGHTKQAEAPATVQETLRSPGQPLDATTRAFMEPRFGYDFSRVRVHTGSEAAQSAKAIGARAYTAGSDVVFAGGHSAASDTNLLAHELAHVVQQTGANTRQAPTVRRQPSPDIDEYIPAIGAPERQPSDPKKNKPEVLGRVDVDTLFENNPDAKKRVEDVAKELDIDPGLLAESLVAETATAWTRTTGKIASEVLGMDDWFDPALAGRLKGIIDAHPGLDLKFSDVKKTGKFWDTSTEKKGGAKKPRGSLDAKKSVPAWAVYMKMQTDMLRDVLAKEPALKNGPIRTLEDLTPEQRLTIERLAANAGVGFAATAFVQLAKGGDIPRTGGIRRDPKHPFRTAALHMGRAVHLDQAIFGRSPSDYKPPEPPISHSEAATRFDMPWVKKLPEWITPHNY
jgi:hypothetical protein